MKRAAILALAVVAGAVLSGCGPQPASGPAETPALAPPSGPLPAQADAAEVDPKMAIVSAPVAGAKVTSPLHVEGMAPGPWFFEAVLPVTLVVNGEIVSEAPGRPQEDWMTVERVPFTSEITFDVTAETPAELVVAQDMPGFDDNGDELPPLEIRIPVVLTPAGAP
jgi:hypothetical protein